MHSLGRKLYRMYSGNMNSLPQFSLNKLKMIQLPNFVLGADRNLFSTLTTEDPHEQVLKEVSNGDQEVEYKLKVLTMEMELLRQEGEQVPEDNQMKAKHYIELLKLKHRSGRKRYLQYLFKLTKKKENELRKKQEKAIKLEESRKTKLPKDLPLEEFAHTYDLQHNNMFLRIRDKSMNKLYNSKMIQAMQFGQKLIIDCGFHNMMTERENRNCAKQLMLLFGDNRIHDDPYDLHFCNFDKSSTLGKAVHTHIPTLYEPDFPLNVHEVNYLNIFPKEKLVYLTPHCREEMKEYDHDALYIVGGIVDKVNQAPLSLAKAKEQNIKMLKFPLDKYLMWTSGSGKSLTLNQVVAILLDMKKTGDWKYSLRHVPTRKIVKDEDLLEDVTKKLLETRKKWTPKVNLDNLSYNRKVGKSGYRNQEYKYTKRRQVSVSSLFRDD